MQAAHAKRNATTPRRTPEIQRAEGTPLPDSKAEQPPLIRRAEVVAFALVALLVICVVAVLYVAQGVLPAGRDGIRGRHHAVAGRQLARAPPDSPRLRRRADRDRGRRGAALWSA